VDATSTSGNRIQEFDLMSIPPEAPARPPGAPPAFYLLAKPSGSACNLDCAYGFFLDKERLYSGSKFRMSETMLEQYIRQLIESHQTDTVNIAWQGGEPTLMGLDFYRRAMAMAEKYRRPGMPFLHTMQTNGGAMTQADQNMGQMALMAVKKIFPPA
jgi:uncharacterized protein